MRYFGSIGFGMVWGWLILLPDERNFRRPFVAITLSITTMILAAEVYYLANLKAIPFFVAATAAAAFVHSQWRRELLKRCDH